ncbi:MAG: hypothetical protein U0795_26960 [Pirellulales bacterium]
MSGDGTSLPDPDESVAGALKSLGPKSATIGGNSFATHSVADLIAWQRHQVLLRAARNPLGAVRSVRLTPSPSCRRIGR